MRWLGPAAAATAAVTIGSAAAAGAFGGGSQPRVADALPPRPVTGTGLVHLAKGVPCAGRHPRPVGPKAVRRFHAVTAVSCVEQTRIYPGHGEWWVRVRRVAVTGVARLQRYFEQPNEPILPRGGFCDDVGHIVLVPTFVDERGDWVVPRVPLDGCGEPLSGYERITRAARWRVVSVRKERLMVSAAALAASCSMGLKDLPAGGIGPLGATPGGPIFRTTPRTVRVCIYRTGDAFQVGRFVRGFRLDVAQTRRLLGAATGAGPDTNCPDQPLFAAFGAGEQWAEVELGGCWRVGRTYPDYAIGSANPAVVRAILSAR